MLSFRVVDSSALSIILLRNWPNFSKNGFLPQFQKIYLIHFLVSARCYAAPRKSNLPGDQEEDFVDVENAEQLCKFVCIKYKEDEKSFFCCKICIIFAPDFSGTEPGPAIRSNAEYPAWLFELDLDRGKVIFWKKFA